MGMISRRPAASTLAERLQATVTTAGGARRRHRRRARTEQELSGPGLLTGVAEQSGGRYFAIEHLADVPDVVAKLGVDLRAPAPR